MSAQSASFCSFTATVELLSTHKEVRREAFHYRQNRCIVEIVKKKESKTGDNANIKETSQQIYTPYPRPTSRTLRIYLPHVDAVHVSKVYEESKESLGTPTLYSGVENVSARSSKQLRRNAIEEEEKEKEIKPRLLGKAGGTEFFSVFVQTQ